MPAGREPTFQVGADEVDVEQSSEHQSTSNSAAVVDQTVPSLLGASSFHTDSEIRQRRLQRLHSMPCTPQQSLSPLVEERRSNEGRAGHEGKIRTSSSDANDEA